MARTRPAGRRLAWHSGRQRHRRSGGAAIAGHGLHWDGVTWTAVDTGTPMNLNAVTSVPPSAQLIATSSPRAMAASSLKWNGIRLATTARAPTAANLYATCNGANGTMIVGGRGGAFTMEQGAATWTQYPINFGTSSATPVVGATSAGDAWAAFNSDLLYDAPASRIVHIVNGRCDGCDVMEHGNISQILSVPGGGVWLVGRGILALDRRRPAGSRRTSDVGTGVTGRTIIVGSHAQRIYRAMGRRWRHRRGWAGMA